MLSLFIFVTSVKIRSNFMTNLSRKLGRVNVSLLLFSMCDLSFILIVNVINGKHKIAITFPTKLYLRLQFSYIET